MRGPEQFFLACAFRTCVSARSPTTPSASAPPLEAMRTMRTMGREAMMRASDDGDGDGDGEKSSSSSFDEDKMLLLDALEQQASNGPCTGARPWEFWDPAGALAHDAWSMLGALERRRAMAMYVEVVSSAYPDWFHLLTKNMSEKQKRKMIATAKECALEYYRALANGSLGTREMVSPQKHTHQTDASASFSTSFLDECFASTTTAGTFIQLPNRGDEIPRARSGHVSALLHDDALFVSHGRSGRGKLIADFWRLDLRTGVWNEQALHWPGSTCSGLASAAVGEHMFVFRGKGPFDLDENALYDVQVSVMNLDANFGSSEFKWTHVRCTVDGDGRFPCARSMHTASTCGDRVFVFGGVDASGDDLDELWEYIPSTSSWRQLASAGHARSGHTATSVDDRYLLVCGGSIGNELHDCSSVDVYDAASDVWKTVACAADRREDAPCRRAMHAAAIFGNKWIIVGGGDNEKPVCDAYWLDVRKCVDEDECAWEKMCDAKLVGREGMSATIVASAATKNSYLLLHGGLNEAGTSNATVACKLDMK